MKAYPESVEVAILAKFVLDTQRTTTMELACAVGYHWQRYRESEMDLENYLFAIGLDVDGMKVAVGIDRIEELLWLDATNED